MEDEMGKDSAIEWTHHTFNPWIGCVKVSDGCKNCYAERYGHRFGVEWGVNGERRVTSRLNWEQPYLWDRAARREGVRRRVFCASLADVFERRVDLDGLRNKLFRLIEATPHLDWLLLTKRPENVLPLLERSVMSLWGNGLPDHVWIGTSVENQEMADKRIPELLKVPARVRFLSVEPMLGPVDLSNWFDGYFVPDIHWVIAGGESGPGARLMYSGWVKALRDQCAAACVCFFFKQWGGRNKATAGRVLDGRTWDEVPGKSSVVSRQNEEVRCSS
jgi:protein gp37